MQGEKSVTEMRRRKPALGTKHHDKSKNRPMSENYTRVSVALDDEMFAHVRARALRHGTSFAEQVRVLLELGAETAREACV